MILDNSATHRYLELGNLISDYFLWELETPFRGVYCAKITSPSVPPR